MYKYPLQTSPFSLLDKLKVSLFILSGERLTQGDKVKEYEKIWADYTGSKYAVFVNSGSSANFLVAQRLKDKLIQSGRWNKQKTVIFPSLTWATSVSPFIILGFKPHFIDINKTDWALDYDLTRKYLDKNYEKVAAIFPTALLGMNFNEKFFDITQSFNHIEFLFDGCEHSFGQNENRQNLLSKTTSTTSTFYAHFANSIEGGLIFCNDKEDYKYYLMARNHGLVRALCPYEDILGNHSIDIERNKDVNKEFDFRQEGLNFRNTDLNAYFGILDSRRWDKMIKHRIQLGNYWYDNLDKARFSIPFQMVLQGSVPFCLPLVTKHCSLFDIQYYLNNKSIESRPIIGGSLRRQTYFKPFMKGVYPVADHLHTNGLYIGLNDKLKIKDLKWIINGLNQL